MAAGPVVRAKIHPGIGVARVGNSPDGFFIGPEVTEPAPLPAGGAKDATGALKRQAARFRIYGYDAAGKVVGELTADQAEIVWTVHVANKKAAWYQFQLAHGHPRGRLGPGRQPPQRDRHRRRPGEADHQPGPAEIDAAGTPPAPRTGCDTGKFYGKPVYLGELRTDEAGRLLFLGGTGRIGLVRNRPAASFAQQRRLARRHLRRDRSEPA